MSRLMGRTARTTRRRGRRGRGGHPELVLDGLLPLARAVIAGEGVGVPERDGYARAAVGRRGMGTLPS